MVFLVKKGGLSIFRYRRIFTPIKKKNINKGLTVTLIPLIASIAGQLDNRVTEKI